jgi:nucleotide-binding universal stress UspA family protein
MPLNKILWASDGSKESRGALRWAEMLASRFGAKITAISVVESSDISRFEVPDKLKEEMSLIDRELVTKESKRLRRVETILKQKGVEIETRVAKGVPYQEIIKAAQSQGADLIAMGKRGLNLWARMMLGSTTTRVLREVHLPVLTVREWTKQPVIKRIVVPSSFAPADNVSLQWALELAGTLGASICLLHIFEAHKSWDTAKGKFMVRQRELDTEKLNAMLASVKTQSRKDVPVSTRVKAYYRPWSGIVSFVRDEGVDMIVMCTHTRKGVPRLFLGSVAERVITEAPCPVITVRP